MAVNLKEFPREVTHIGIGANKQLYCFPLIFKLPLLILQFGYFRLLIEVKVSVLVDNMTSLKVFC